VALRVGQAPETTVLHVWHYCLSEEAASVTVDYAGSDGERESANAVARRCLGLTSVANS